MQPDGTILPGDGFDPGSISTPMVRTANATEFIALFLDDNHFADLIPALQQISDAAAAVSILASTSTFVLVVVSVYWIMGRFLRPFQPILGVRES